jgi:hypothetical protein
MITTTMIIQPTNVVLACVWVAFTTTSNDSNFRLQPRHAPKTKRGAFCQNLVVPRQRRTSTYSVDLRNIKAPSKTSQVTANTAESRAETHNRRTNIPTHPPSHVRMHHTSRHTTGLTRVQLPAGPCISNRVAFPGRRMAADIGFRHSTD